jgi:hypothetical protein
MGGSCKTKSQEEPMGKLFKTFLIVAVLVAASAAIAAAQPDKTDGFVCPVLGGHAGENGNPQNFVQIGGGDYTIIGPNVNVPVHATNQDGAGTPGGAHASPGDAGYSPIWATP